MDVYIYFISFCIFFHLKIKTFIKRKYNFKKKNYYSDTQNQDTPSNPW